MDFADWRPGDQKVYISDIDKIQNELGWIPEIGVRVGLKLYAGYLIICLYSNIYNPKWKDFNHKFSNPSSDPSVFSENE